MENSVWRLRARIVAVIDMVVICLSITLVAVLLAMVGSVFVWVDHMSSNSTSELPCNNTVKPPEQIPSYLYWIIGIIAVVSIFLIVIQFVAAIKLFTAGKMGEDPQIALRKATIWRNVTIALAVFSIAGNLRRLEIIPIVITVVWRGISLYVVQEFMAELKSFIKSPSAPWNNAPLDVLAMK